MKGRGLRIALGTILAAGLIAACSNNAKPADTASPDLGHAQMSEAPAYQVDGWRLVEVKERILCLIFEGEEMAVACAGHSPDRVYVVADNLEYDPDQPDSRASQIAAYLFALADENEAGNVDLPNLVPYRLKKVKQHNWKYTDKIKTNPRFKDYRETLRPPTSDTKPGGNYIPPVSKKASPQQSAVGRSTSTSAPQPSRTKRCSRTPCR